MAIISYDEDLVISYSSMQTLQACPRSFQLTKVNPIEVPREHSPALSQGSAVGLGYAKALELGCLSHKLTEDELNLVKFETWRGYYPRLEDNVRSVTKAHVIVQKLVETPLVPESHEDPLDWELAKFNGKLATELSFAIRLTPSMVYVGFLDAVLYSPSLNIYRPLELKTSSLTTNLQVNFANSLQGLGYGLVLDYITGGKHPNYTVHYRVAQCHKTKAEAYRPTIHDFYFKKDLESRLEFLSTLLLDTKQIESYLEHGFFPKRGNSCLAWSRPCRFYGICGLTDNPPIKTDKTIDAQFYFDINDLQDQTLTMIQEL